MKQELVTCNKCKWVYMGVSAQFALHAVSSFNEFYETLADDKKELYYNNKKASIDTYLSCGCGNNYKNFRKTMDREVPNGSTINPILHYDEVLP